MAHMCTPACHSPVGKSFFHTKYITSCVFLNQKITVYIVGDLVKSWIGMMKNYYGYYGDKSVYIKWIGIVIVTY